MSEPIPLTFTPHRHGYTGNRVDQVLTDKIRYINDPTGWEFEVQGPIVAGVLYTFAWVDGERQDGYDGRPEVYVPIAGGMEGRDGTTFDPKLFRAIG